MTEIYADFANYVECAAAGDLDQLSPHIDAGEDNKKNHEKLYDNHFSSTNGCHYPTYRKLRSLKSTFRCPYCGFGRIKVVDHFLPKAVFFRYSVLLDNLVPCCHECNDEKGEDYAAPGRGAILHPYFDQVPNFKWLKASFSSKPFSVSFSVLDTVDAALQARLRNHLRVFDLAENYAELSVNYFTNIKNSLAAVSSATDPAGLNLPKHLDELRDQSLTDCGGDINNWKVSFLDDLIDAANAPERASNLILSL